MDPAEITYEMVNRKMREIIGTRGRRGTDKQEQVRCGVLVACCRQPPSLRPVLGRAAAVTASRLHSCFACG